MSLRPWMWTTNSLRINLGGTKRTLHSLSDNWTRRTQILRPTSLTSPSRLQVRGMDSTTSGRSRFNTSRLIRHGSICRSRQSLGRLRASVSWTLALHCCSDLQRTSQDFGSRSGTPGIQTRAGRCAVTARPSSDLSSVTATTRKSLSWTLQTSIGSLVRRRTGGVWVAYRPMMGCDILEIWLFDARMLTVPVGIFRRLAAWRHIPSSKWFPAPRNICC